MRSTGSAVYVFGILSYSITDPASSSDISFYIDGDPAGSFQFTPTGQPTYSYNAILYANASLQYANHTLSLQNGRFGGGLSLILLDYIIYSTYVHRSCKLLTGLTHADSEEIPSIAPEPSPQPSPVAPKLSTSLVSSTPISAPPTTSVQSTAPTSSTLPSPSAPSAPSTPSRQSTSCTPSTSYRTSTFRSSSSKSLTDSPTTTHTTTQIILLATLLPMYILLPALVLAFTCHSRRRRLHDTTQQPAALAYNPLVTASWSDTSLPQSLNSASARRTSTASQHRTTRRESLGIVIRDGAGSVSAFGSENERAPGSTSPACATAASSAPILPGTGPPRTQDAAEAAAEVQRVRAKITAERDRSKRHAAQRRVQERRWRALEMSVFPAKSCPGLA